MYTGIDPGLIVTGIVTLTNSGTLHSSLQFGRDINESLKRAQSYAEPARYLLYYNHMIKYLATTTVGTCIIEQPMGQLLGNGRKVITLTGVYFVALAQHVPANKIFTPKATEIKKTFTRTGLSTKDEIKEECAKRGHHFNCHHLADACAMAYMGVDNKL